MIAVRKRPSEMGEILPDGNLFLLVYRGRLTFKIPVIRGGKKRCGLFNVDKKQRRALCGRYIYQPIMHGCIHYLGVITGV